MQNQKNGRNGWLSERELDEIQTDTQTDRQREREKVVATLSKLRWYEARTEEYVKNSMFQTNQAKLFEIMEKENRSNYIRPRKQESVK